MNIRLFILLGFGICSFMITSQIYAATDMKSGYPVEIASNGKSNANIFWTRVSTEKGELEVAGKVKRTHRTRQVAMGHIDIAIVDQSGNVLMDNSTLYSPQRIHKELRRASKFSVLFSSLPPKGSIIRLSYHRNPQQESARVSSQALNTGFRANTAEAP